jgi:hypothetical protein
MLGVDLSLTRGENHGADEGQRGDGNDGHREHGFDKNHAFLSVKANDHNAQSLWGK